jgi:L-amino acid N-acyltransferase YncA
MDAVGRKGSAAVASKIRFAVEADAGELVEIYGPFCGADSPVSFELEPPSVEEMRRRVESIGRVYPWLLMERDGCVLGYAYASRFRDRAAYRWATEVTCYIREGHRGRGIGHDLYAVLLEMLVWLGYGTAHAGITLPNPASVRLHESFGFEPVGAYRRVGYKCGTWHDVGTWQLELRAPEAEPAEPRSLAVVGADPHLAGILGNAGARST